MRPSSRRTSRVASQAGFTLVELLVTSAVGVVVVGAATLTFVNQMRLEREITRKNQVQTELSVAAMILDRQLQNAGMNFAEMRHGFRVRNNVTGQLPGGGGTQLPVVELGSPAAGALARSDAIEVRYAEPTNRRAGTVVSCPAGGCSQGSGVGAVNLSTTEPLTIAEATVLSGASAESGPFLVFTNGLGVSCLGRATRVTLGITTRFDYMYYTDDLDPDATGQANCPAAGMMVYAADVQERYLVAQTANGEAFGLSRQVFDMTTLRWGAPELLVSGVEDMQVVPRIQDAAGNLVPTNDAPVPTTVLGPTNDFRVRAANVRLIVVGAQPLETGLTVRKPPAFDRLEEDIPTGSNVELTRMMRSAYRAVSEISVSLPNAGLLAN